MLNLSLDPLMPSITSLGKIILLLGLTVLLTIFVVRIVQISYGPELNLWHRYVPNEVSADKLNQMTWPEWLVQEERLMQDVAAQVSAKLPKDLQLPQHRFWANAPMNPQNLPYNWNRTTELWPDLAGQPPAPNAPSAQTAPPAQSSPNDTPAKGVVVLLHGLSDSPYSLRHVGTFYQAKGWHVIALRLPGHGTVPAGLTTATTEKWQAATRLAIRRARAVVPDGPLHLVGYSTGGSLALLHALEAIESPELHRPDQIILFSPLVGLTPFARFSGLAALPAFIPAFIEAAWLDILPEFNPYKYNSFPVKAGVEAHALTQQLTRALAQAKADGRIAHMPPVLAFQSVVDSTVRAIALREDLYDHLPENGSRLVLVDVNHAAYVGPMLNDSAKNALQNLLPPSPRPYEISAITNRSPASAETLVRTWPVGAVKPVETPLNIPYRRDFFSLGHIALPMPLSDGLYGASPDPADRQGVSLGVLATRGENDILAIPGNLLSRVSSNPFFPWMLKQIEPTLTAPSPKELP